MLFWPGTKSHKFAFRPMRSSTKPSRAACDSLVLTLHFPYALHPHSILLACLPIDILKAEEIKYLQNTSKQQNFRKKSSLQHGYRFQIQVVWIWAVFPFRCRWYQFRLSSLNFHSLEKQNCSNHLVTFTWTQTDQASDSCCWPATFTFTLYCIHGWNSHL